MKYLFGGLPFTSKTAALAYVRDNIHVPYPSNTNLSPAHLRFMLDLLSHHPCARQKVGCGVRRMWLRPVTYMGYPSRCFWLERVDGSRVNFSYKSCLIPSGALGDFKKACRLAIVEFVSDFRASQFARRVDRDGRIPCPLTGKLLLPGESHVDHVAPLTFDKIVTDFIAEYAVDVDCVTYAVKVDEDGDQIFTDAALQQNWLAFHNSRAVLRILSVPANCGLARRRQPVMV